MNPTYAYISLTRGKVATIEADRYDEVAKFSWYCTSHGYAATRERGTGKMIYLHRLIARAPNGVHVDHINGDKLYCVDSNLRHCSNDQNALNRGPSKRCKSGFRGVSWSNSSRSWCAFLRRGHRYYIGSFKTAEEAARAYDREAIAFRGEFARTNFDRSLYV